MDHSNPAAKGCGPSKGILPIIQEEATMMDESFRPDQNSTFVESKDFSLSSLIQNFSQLLDGNTSSSFLMHVDDKPKSVPHPIRPECVQYEHFRRMLDIYEDRQYLDRGSGLNANSWDEFDKIMEASLPSKMCELIEFRDLAKRSSLRSSGRSRGTEDGFMSAEDAQREMDKEEAIRAQFIQPEDATFLSQHNGTATSLFIDPLSMTNYFQSRSSFPVDNCANDSTMFGQTVREGQQHQGDDGGEEGDEGGDYEKTLCGPHPSVFQELFDKKKKEKAEVMGKGRESTESTSTAAVQKFLMSSKSNGVSPSSITDYIIQACKSSVERRGGGGATKPSTVSSTTTTTRPSNFVKSGDLLQITPIKEKSDVKVLKRPGVVSHETRTAIPKTTTTAIPRNSEKPEQLNGKREKQDEVVVETIRTSNSRKPERISIPSSNSGSEREKVGRSSAPIHQNEGSEGRLSTEKTGARPNIHLIPGGPPPSSSSANGREKHEDCDTTISRSRRSIRTSTPNTKTEMPIVPPSSSSQGPTQPESQDKNGRKEGKNPEHHYPQPTARQGPQVHIHGGVPQYYGYGMPLSIHIHLPAAPPYGPPPSYPPQNDHQQPHHFHPS